MEADEPAQSNMGFVTAVLHVKVSYRVIVKRKGLRLDQPYANHCPDVLIVTTGRGINENDSLPIVRVMDASGFDIRCPWFQSIKSTFSMLSS